MNNDNPFEQELQDEYNIVEKPNHHPVESEQPKGYDWVVSEAAVGSVEGVTFTVAGFRDEQRDGKTVYTTYLDINRSQIVNIEKGTIVKLKEGLSLEVVDIVGAEEPQKGKVYFKRI